MMTDRLIVGLDLPNVAEAEKAVRELDGVVNFYKIGYRLVFAGGLELARDLAADGKKIFLDMKLLDIDNTVAEGVENVVRMGVTMLTVHAYPKAMRAAVAAAKGSDLCLLGVTVLTSMDAGDLAEAGYADDPHTLVRRRAEQARQLHRVLGNALLLFEVFVHQRQRIVGKRDARHLGALQRQLLLRHVRGFAAIGAAADRAGENEDLGRHALRIQRAARPCQKSLRRFSGRSRAESAGGCAR